MKAQGFLGAIGYVLGDLTLTEGEASLLEEIPSTAQDPASVALALTERRIEAGPTQSLDAQKALAAAAPNLNRLRGRPLGMLLALYYADFPGAVLVQQNGLAFTLSGAPVLADLAGMVALPSWCTRAVLANANPPIPLSTDGKPAIPANTVPWSAFAGDPMDANGNQFNSRFAVLFPAITNDGGMTWSQPIDLTIAANLARVRRVIKSWRPAKATCSKIVVVASGYVYGWPPTTVYGGAGITYGGSSTSYTA